MKKHKWRKAPLVLLVFGALLVLAGLTVLSGVEDVLQFAVPAPDRALTAEDIEGLLEMKTAADAQMSDSMAATALGGTIDQSGVSSEKKSGTATVYAIGEGWLEVSPVFLKTGRRISETELRRGDFVAMIDENLAFELYGSEMPEGATVTVNGAAFEVVGTLRHSRGVGDPAEYCVYIPLTACKDMQLDTLLMSAKPLPNTGARTLFERTMRSVWRQNGSFYSLEKEAMRRTMVLRLMLLVFGMSGILALLRRMNGVAQRQIDGWREGMRWSYFARMLPRLLGVIGICIAGYGALLALTCGLMVFSIQPLYVFTEWIPENIVEWSSITDVFWNLTGSAAQTVKVGTREMRQLEFWGAMVRWGALTGLWGALLLRRKR